MLDIYFTEVTLDNPQEVIRLSGIATAIVKDYYDPIVGSEQNDYMIQMFQSVEALERQLRGHYRYYIVDADEAGQRTGIGFLAFYKRSGAQQDELYLSKFYLSKEYRGRGIGKEMLAFVVKQAESMGLQRIVLNVNKHNGSIDIYKRLGFVKIRDEVNDIGNGYVMDDYVMQYRMM